MSEFWLYFKLGLTHVLDIKAYDHVLFLIALTVPYSFRDWKRVIVLVTIFTIGHSLSLVLSAYGIVRINTVWVEFLIPLTILATALYNIFTSGRGAKNEKAGMLFFAALFFGIVHGLGFAGYFNAIIGNASSKVLPLLEFALGIEVSQVVVVFFVLLFAFIVQPLFRFSKRDWIMVVSAMVAGAVIPMLIENDIW